MALFDTRRKVGGLKETLPVNIPGASNRITIRTGQQVDNNLVTNKQLEQQTIKPKRVGGLKRGLRNIGTERFGRGCRNSRWIS